MDLQLKNVVKDISLGRPDRHAGLSKIPFLLCPILKARLLLRLTNLQFEFIGDKTIPVDESQGASIHLKKNGPKDHSMLGLHNLKNYNMEPNIGIKDANLSQVAIALNRLLADEFLLLTKTRNAHWNVEGPDFLAAHRFFEEQCIQLDRAIDDLAERIRSIGHYPVAILKSFLGLTHLSEQTRAKNDSQGFMMELLSDHESIIKQLRGDIIRFTRELNDSGTGDFITGLIRLHEKSAWMLRSHLPNT